MMRIAKLIGDRFVVSSALIGVAGLVVLLTTAGAQAGSSPFTFAQFVQSTQSSDDNQFAYIDNGPAIENDPAADAVLTTDAGGEMGVSIPVIFTYQSLNGTLPADLQGPQQATLTLTSSTTAGVQTANVFGETLTQQQVFGNGAQTDTLTITRNTPAAEGAGSQENLLTMTFTGMLAGVLGTPTPSLSGDTNNNDTVTYTSDFLTFSPEADNDFNMAFSSWTTVFDEATEAADIAGLGLSQSPIEGDSYYASATAAGAATFDTTVTPSLTTSVPEPGACTIALGLGLLMLMRRRTAAIAAA